MIRVVFFDVGGTLIAAHPSVGAIYAEIASRHGLSIEPQILQERFKDAFKVRDPLETAGKLGWEKIVRKIFSDEKVANFNSLFEDIFSAFREPSRWQIFPDVVPSLESLRNKGIRLAVASNWDDRLPGLLHDLGLDRYFEKLFISFQTKTAKPDVAFFRHAMTAMNVDPLEAMHVGDHEIEDVEGAQKAGMRAYLIDRTRKPRNSRELVSLTEILDRI
jgi:putative hydrolase of the HAD superfamily